MPLFNSYRCLKIFGVGLICALCGSCAATVEIADDSHTIEPGPWVYIVADYDQIERADDPAQREGDAHYLLGGLGRGSLMRTNDNDDLEKGEREPEIIEQILICCVYPPNILTMVQVIETIGTRVLFGGGWRHPGRFFGWVDQKYLIDPEQFERVIEWPGKLFMEVCVEFVGCRLIHSLRDGDIKISMSGDDYDASCPFERDNRGKCTTNGHAEIFGNYLVFVTDSGSPDNDRYEPFIIQQDGRLCWAEVLQEYNICMPLVKEYYKQASD